MAFHLSAIFFNRIKAIALFIAFIFFTNLHAQLTDTSSLRSDAPKVFINCEDCDIQYFTNEITYLNFVRDRHLADVVVLIRSINTGSGGTEYTFDFCGENYYKGCIAAEKFNSLPNMSNAEIREGMKQALTKGILIYLLKSPLAGKIEYSVKGLEERGTADNVKDKWNLWLFNINGSINGNGQEYSKALFFNSNFSANRTSEKNRFETGFFQFGNYQKYNIDDTTTIVSSANSFGAYSFDAISVGKKLAVGYFSTYFSSTVQNLVNSTSFYPAVEYNVFPYEEATRRQLRFNYRIGGRYVDFYDQTYLNKYNDWYFLHSLVISYRQVEKWGNLSCDIGTFQYFSKEKFYRVNITPDISWNIASGLNLSLGGNFSVVNDQYYLKKDEVSSEAILLGQTQLKSNFSYNFYVGISFSFGSIYNNVVNVRFNMNDNNW
ncbi:MAG: hypothetical protein WAQ28_19740 [Bacteroidia bacterium]|jgi:hypothetical protein